MTSAIGSYPGATYYNRVNKMHALSAEYGHSVQNRGISQRYTDGQQSHSSTVLGDDQLSFFAFEPPHSASPFPPISNSAELFSSWNSPMQAPLSPPMSALSSSPKGKLFFEQAQAPPTILTDIDPANISAQYGQITPPDDESPNMFHHEHLHVQLAKPAPADGFRKRKRMLTSTKEPITSPSPKRVRKNATHSTSNDQTVNPNDIEQVRRSKFLERNRVAASKCRQKKKQWIDKLEAQLREQNARHNSLRLLVDSLKNEAFYLKVEMAAHKGCNVPSIRQRIERDPESFEEAIKTYDELERDKKCLDDAGCPPHHHPGNADRDADPEQTQNLQDDDMVSLKPSSSPSPLEDIDPLEELLLHDLRQDSKDEII